MTYYSTKGAVLGNGFVAAVAIPMTAVATQFPVAFATYAPPVMGLLVLLAIGILWWAAEYEVAAALAAAVAAIAAVTGASIVMPARGGSEWFWQGAVPLLAIVAFIGGMNLWGYLHTPTTEEANP